MSRVRLKEVVPVVFTRPAAVELHDHLSTLLESWPQDRGQWTREMKAVSKAYVTLYLAIAQVTP